MKKQIILVVAIAMLSGNGFVIAEETKKENVSLQVQAVEVNNHFCPLSGRELNMADSNDFTKLTVEGLIFNVCPVAMVKYKKDASLFADKVAAAVTKAKADLAAKVGEVVAPEPVVAEVPKVEAPKVEEAKVEVPVEAPKVEEVKVEVSVEAPKVEVPQVEEAKVDVPVEAPKVEEPTVEEPKAVEINSEAPAEQIQK